MACHVALFVASSPHFQQRLRTWMKTVSQVSLFLLTRDNRVVSVVLLGVIGGSGLYHLDNLTFVYVWVYKFEIGTLTYQHHIYRKHVNPETVSVSFDASCSVLVSARSPGVSRLRLSRSPLFHLAHVSLSWPDMARDTLSVPLLSPLARTSRH